jgi:hypothetical protein
MNKITLRYILFIIAGAVILLYILRGRSPFGSSNTDFAVKQGTDITGIDFFQGDKKLSLRKSDGTWKVNKSGEIRKSAVLFIIRTLKEMKIKSPVSSEVFRNEIIDKEIIPVRVNVYQRRKLVKSFYVYKTGSNVYGNIMKMRVGSKPFIVFVPGYEDNLGTHFNLNELFWRPFTVYNLLPSGISAVEFENFREAGASFTIKNSGGLFSLSDEHGNLSGWDTLRVKRYISYFTSIPFESWAFDISNDEKKEIESQTPLYRINVSGTAGGNRILTLWEKWNNNDGPKNKDTDRVWGKIEGTDNLVILRYFDVDPILKRKSFFFGE